MLPAQVTAEISECPLQGCLLQAPVNIQTLIRDGAGNAELSTPSMAR